MELIELVKLVSDFFETFGMVGAVVAPFVLIWIWINWRTFFPKASASDEQKARLANDLERRRRWISARSIEQRYLRLLKELLSGITRLTHDADSLEDSRTATTWPVRWFGVNPFTEGSYLLCLRLALAYPILSVFVVWLLGGEGAVAGITLLPVVESDWQRVLAAAWLVLFGFLFFKFLRSQDWRSWIYLLAAFAFAFAFAVAGAGAVAGAFAVAVAVAGAGAGAVAGAVELIRGRLHSKRSIVLSWLGFNLFYIIAVLLVLAWALPQADNLEWLLIPVFLVLLPLVNAALDWLSLAFTRGLLHAIGRRRHTGLVALFFAGFDIVLALVFLFLIASLTILLLSLLNLATFTWDGSPLLDLQWLFDGLALEPGALEFGWIHFMMLSTLIPTLIHFLVAGFAAVLLLPERLRQWMLEGWDDSEDVRRVAFGWISLAPVLALAGPTLLLWGLYELLTAWGGIIGQSLLAWVHGIALAVDPSTTAPLP